MAVCVLCSSTWTRRAASELAADTHPEQPDQEGPQDLALLPQLLLQLFLQLLPQLLPQLLALLQEVLQLEEPQ